MLTCSFCSVTQAALEPADEEKWCHCFQYGMVSGAFPWAKESRMSQNLILIDALSCLLGEERGKKVKRPGALFPGPEARHNLLAVPGGIFMAVRCN
jgi:hypothetical protein